ncbi:MAG: RDD family protein [Candidatus Dormibacteraeota bacterium]|uniref:RDD family protein n=1 Tax=Candidatus Dormiibacter inghamiae TaxID=3127013 RepID=A0A934KBI1_9BACT|nr:RDD family protein [Candidatus Dormibacteraeota bacterium]MBJ7604992.1 RDD family protein [Candidatus Dormibacteraeota bacterium]
MTTCETVTVVDTLRSRPPAVIPDDYLPAMQRLTYGLVRARGDCLSLGPVTLLRFEPPSPQGSGWRWVIQGGLLARQPGGTLSVGWQDGRLVGEVAGYSPRLPPRLYELTQLPLHHALMRLYLLGLRGRVPPPGLPVGAAQRLAAAALDLALCAAGTVLARPPARRFLPLLAGVTSVYHVGFWCLAASTPGGRALGQRVVGLDGRRPSLLQAVLRLTAVPLAVRARRALHDERAGTDVIESATI